MSEASERSSKTSNGASDGAPVKASNSVTDDTITIETPNSGTYKRLLGYLSGLWGVFLLSIIGFILYAGTNAWFADLFSQLVDMIGDGSNFDSSQRLYFPMLLILIVATRGLGGFLGAYFMAKIATHVIHKLRCELLEKFLRLPIRFYDKNSSGHLLSTVTYNTTQVNLAVSDSLAVILREGATVVALLAYMLYKDWMLTLAFFAITPLISIVVLYASKKFRKHSNRIQISMGDVTQIIAETVKGLKVIKTFGAEVDVSQRFNQSSDLNRKQNLKLERTLAISTPIIQLVVVFALAFLIWLAMTPDRLVGLSGGDFVAFILAAGMMLKPIRQLSRVNAPIQKGLAAADSIFQTLDEDEESNHGTHTKRRIEGRIEFRKANFTYKAESDKVLHDISFTCEPGKTIAIVGKSGSGKSTLVNLLPRFYELNSGQILIDGVDHHHYDLANLRSQLSLVAQQVVLFNGSIRDNIAYGQLNTLDDEKIIEALRYANAMEFIEALPDGINTLVGDDGMMLSGGQRQRLAIARALLKNAPILILDEATSALDTQSERYIQDALETLMAGRTTFVIAHRLSTIENADKILVMQDGRIIEQGTHAELIERKGHYAELHQVQFKEE